MSPATQQVDAYQLQDPSKDLPRRLAEDSKAANRMIISRPADCHIEAVNLVENRRPCLLDVEVSAANVTFRICMTPVSEEEA